MVKTNRINKIIYTIKHKKAFLKVEKELFEKNSLSGYLHDIDKIIMLLLLPMSIKTISKIHRKISKHHIEFMFQNFVDYREAYIDWECARLTKPDKPLNGIETCKKFYPQCENEILKVMKGVGNEERIITRKILH